MQTGVLGGHLRVASVGCFNNGSTATTTAGFEMLVYGPLAADNDTILIRIRGHRSGAVDGERRHEAPAGRSNSPPVTRSPSADEAPHPQPFAYLKVSLNRRNCVGSPCAPSTVDAAVFYAAVLDHALHWNATFAKAAAYSVPYVIGRRSILIE
jgi:hypothetical protein